MFSSDKIVFAKYLAIAVVVFTLTLDHTRAEFIHFQKQASCDGSAPDEVLPSRSKSQCAAFCRVRYPHGCRGFNFREDVKRCELFSTHSNYVDPTTPPSKCSYYQADAQMQNSATDNVGSDGPTVQATIISNSDTEANTDSATDSATMLTSEESTDQTTFQMSTIPGTDPTARANCIPVNSFSGTCNFANVSSSSLRIPPNPSFLPVTMVDDWIVIFHTDRAHTCPQFFNKSWIEYRGGFGDCSAEQCLGECYLGNENIYQLTVSGNYALRIQIFNKSYQRALILEYDSFSIADESNKYRLSVSGFRNLSELYPYTTGDCLNRAKYHGDGEKFSTPDPDQDNDSSGGHCARTLGIGWWESNCGSCALTDRCTWGKHSVTGRYVMEDECLMMIKEKV